jgi:transketolase
LQQRGVSLRHLHVSTLKPFDDRRLIELAAEARRGIITMENHVVTGGLGSAVAERLAECGAGRRLVRIGLRDSFAHGASRPFLMKAFGLDASALVREVERLLDARFDIEDQELLAVRIEPVHNGAKAEAL